MAARELVKAWWPLFRTAMIDGLAAVRQFSSENGHLWKHSDTYSVGRFDSGLPHFTLESGIWGNAPTNYGSAFSSIGLKTAPRPSSWGKVADLFRDHESLAGHYGIKEDVYDFGGSEGRWSVLYSSIVLEQMLDHYVHTRRTQHFRWRRFVPIYVAWARSVLSERLPIDVLAPIVCVTYDGDRLEMADGFALERIPESTQRARGTRGSYAVPVSAPLVGAATHCLVLEEWTMANENRDERDRALGSLDAFDEAVSHFDRALAAIRIVTDAACGYGQIVTRPINWSGAWTADLSHVYVVGSRSYPAHLEDYGWLRSPHAISVAEGRKIVGVYRRLAASESNQVRLAVRRLNGAYLRESDEDAILDVTMGLEALMTPDSKSGEVTHKLATRLAALSAKAHFRDFRAEEVFHSCKKVYNYRSAVIHGADDTAKTREVALQGRDPEPTFVLARDLLRYALEVVTEHPTLLQAPALDALLCEGAG